MQDAGSVGLLHGRLADLPTRRAHGSHAGPTRLFAHPNATDQSTEPWLPSRADQRT